MLKSTSSPPPPRPRSQMYESDWVNLYADRVEFPGGRIIERHHFVHIEQDSVGTLAENGEGKLLLVQSYRYTTGTVNGSYPPGGLRQTNPRWKGAAVKWKRRAATLRRITGWSIPLLA